MNKRLEKLVHALGYKRVFHLDYETFSEIDLLTDGIKAYANHPSTEIMLAAYAYDDDDPELYDAAENNHRMNALSVANLKHRDAIHDALLDPDVLIIAWNTSFEREISATVWGIETPADKWLDAMVVAYMMSLPGGLAAASTVLKLDSDHAKDKIGKSLIQLFCKPRPANQKIRRRDWNTDPKQWKQFGGYCIRDVIAERKCLDRMSRFLPPADEIRLWWLDQDINAAGMPIDLDLVDAAQSVTDELKDMLKKECSILTGLTNPNSRAQFLPWIIDQGYPFDSLSKDKVELALRDDAITETGRKALALRGQFSKTSTAKYSKIEAQTVNGFLCYILQFAGAGRTCRWAGRLAQFHNLPRPLKELEDPAAMQFAVDIIKRRDPELLRDLYDEPVNVLASAIRPTLRAPKGKILRVADYNAIENRGLGWVARCESILNVFHKGLDPYKDFGVKLYGVPYDEITKKQRTNSKPAVLGAGYRLGGGALVDVEKKDPSTGKMEKTGEKQKTGLWAYAESLGIDLTKEESHRAVAIFRSEYPEVVEFWDVIEKAVWKVTAEKGDTVVTVPVGFNGETLEIGYTKPALYIRLPSGRKMWYVRPAIRRVKMPWKDENDKPVFRNGITYYGLNQTTRQWQRMTTHGGKLTENVVQAIARDILAHGIKRATEDGFTVILHVHDEVITLEDIDDPAHTVGRLESVLCDLPAWARGMPMAAEGYENPFYMKD